jgi:lipopolysaccharide export system permease protein
MIFFRYVAKEFLRFVFLIVCFFSSVYCVIDFLEKNARYFPRHNARASVIFEYYVVQLPKMFVDLLPFAVLFAAIITFWSLSRSGEIAAARSSGASVLKVSLPVLVSGALLSVLSFALSEWVVPPAQQRLRVIETVKIQKSELGRMFLESHWIRSDERILHFRKYDRVTGALVDPTLYVFADWSSLSAVIRSSYARFDERSQSWVLQDALRAGFPVTGTGGLSFSVHPLFDSGIAAEPPRILSSGIQPNELGFFELLGLIRESEDAGISAQKRLVDLYQKLSFPLASFLFVFLALPFAMRKERQAENYTGVVVSLALALIFWAGNFSMRSLAQSEVIPPFAGAFLMNVVLLLFGVFQLRRLNSGI